MTPVQKKTTFIQCRLKQTSDKCIFMPPQNNTGLNAGKKKKMHPKIAFKR